MSSEVDESQSTRRVASPLLMQKREEKKVQSLLGFITLQEKILRHIHLTFRAQEDLLQHTHTRKSSRDTRSVHETHLTSERTRTEQQEVRNLLKYVADKAIEGEQIALSKLF